MIAVGNSIGNYMLTAKLGEGGMGVVYLAEHPVIGRKVAMKAIHPELSRNPEVVSRFVTEAKAVNQIGNEHIVDIHDFGNTPDGEFYFIMEYLQGEALSDRLRRISVIDPERAATVAIQVADALGASHQHGIIHRDLKPENIFLITKGHATDFVKVLDFGLAKLTQGEEKASHKTRTGSVMGTPYYMAPEQCEGKANIDHRADIYSLGVILFEMLTGKVPFAGEGYGEIIVKHITTPAPSPRSINPSISPALEAIVMRALAKGRENRFQTMESMASALADPEAYLESAAHPLPPVASGAPTQLSLGGSGPSATPAFPADAAVSGKVVLGGPAERTPGVGAAKSGPMPSTFRHSAGEIGAAGNADLDEDLKLLRPRRRTPLVLGTLAGLAVAGFAIYYFTQQTTQPAGPPPAPVAAVAPPPAPAKVKLTFKSDPEGATVVRKDTGEALGTTPFSVEVPASPAPIDFLFKKDSFREKVEAFAPAESGQVAVALVPAPAALPPPPPAPGLGAMVAEKKTAAAASKATPERRRRQANPAHRSGSRGMDEDGVLAPSF
jgi:serine/threonine-protein kinase